MKTSEWTSGFAYERARPTVEWLVTRESYLNRDVVDAAFTGVGPAWDGFASGRPEPHEGESLPVNSIAYPVSLTSMLREGG